MHRWIARLLLLVVVTPAFVPLAMAWTRQSMGPHCQRQPDKPVMECHHGMAMSPAAPLSGDSFRTGDSCCQDHACCRGLAMLRWAYAPRPLSWQITLRYAAVIMVSGPQLTSELLPNGDSARAPPRA